MVENGKEDARELSEDPSRVSRSYSAMNGNEFMAIVEQVYSPFLAKMGFSACRSSISGRSYRASFDRKDGTLWISYEPGEDFLLIVVLGRGDGLTGIDDRRKAPRLSDLRQKYMRELTHDDFIDNERYFSGLSANDGRGELLMKAARELRLVLPPYLRDVES